jgi:hypothetical protein
MLPDELRHSASSFVYFSHTAGAEGGMSGAEGFLRLATLLRSRTSSPLSPSAGEGPGVRAALTFPPSPLPLPRCGRGRGRCYLTNRDILQAHLCISPTLRTRKGDERSRRVSASVNATAFTHQLPPLPQRGRGAGVRAALTFPPAPFLSHAVGEEGGRCYLTNRDIPQTHL